MAWSILKKAINDAIKTNGNQEITGSVLQNTLGNIVSSVGENATFLGVLSKSTTNHVPDGPSFYIVKEKGLYSNFGNLLLNDGEFGILSNKGGISSWTYTRIQEAFVDTYGDNKDRAASQKLVTLLRDSFNEKTAQIEAKANTYVLTWNTDFATTRKQVPTELRKKGLCLRYAINGTEWVEEVYKESNYSDSSWASDSSWEYEKFKGEITSVRQSPSLDTRNGVYYTSRAKGIFANFKQSNGTAIAQYKDRYFTIVKQPATGVWALSNLQPILYGTDYSWGAILKGYISVSASVRTDENNVRLFKYRFEVFPNTAVSAINSLILSGGDQSLGILEGVYEFESVQNKILVMANVSTRKLEFSVSTASSTTNDNGEYLPSEDKKGTHILLGACGGQYTAPAYCYFPFVGLHMNIRGFYTGTTYGKTSEICNLSDYSFYDISSKVSGLTFKGECHLDLQDSDEDNIYYVLGTTAAGEYSFENLSLSVTTEKKYSAFAIKKKSGVWSSEEVPLSFCSQNSSAPYHMLNSGTYVIQKSYAPNTSSNFTSNVTGIHGVGNVNLIFVADYGEGCLTLGDWYNVKVYGTVFIDYNQRDNNVRIENCEFTGPYWRTTGSTYFINCHFFKKWYSNVLIKNCKFTFDRMYTYIYGEFFNNVEITGCEFSVKQGSHPIRINKFLSSAIVRGNKVFGGTTGIFFGSQKSLPQSGAIVENNTVMYQSEEGISYDGFGNNYSLVPVIANGNIEQVYNDENGRLVVKPHLYTGTSASDATLVDYPISKINNWKDYYVTFNRGTGIDGTICRIYDYDANANTFTLDIYISSEKIRTTQSVPKLGNGSSDDSIIGVQSGFFDMVVRNNILKSDRQDYCTALSNYLNVFNTLIENNKVYLMNSFMNIAGGNMLGVMETLCWGVKVINNTFMNCNTGTFTSYWDGKLPQFNNVFQGNILKNVKNFGATGQRNFVLKDNIWDNVDNSSIKNCESYIPSEDDLKVHQMGTIYNKFVNDPATLLLQNIEPYVVERNEENVLHLKKL